MWRDTRLQLGLGLLCPLPSLRLCNWGRRDEGFLLRLLRELLGLGSSFRMQSCGGGQEQEWRKCLNALPGNVTMGLCKSLQAGLRYQMENMQLAKHEMQVELHLNRLQILDMFREMSTSFKSCRLTGIRKWQELDQESGKRCSFLIGRDTTRMFQNNETLASDSRHSVHEQQNHRDFG